MGKKQRGFIFSVPEPCHEKWDEMTPNEKGRHCDSCNKTVIDFSLYSDQQLLDFITKQSGKICGRFNNYQLGRPVTPTVPENPSLLKRIAVGTALATTLAACNNEDITTGKVACKKDSITNTVGGLKPLPVIIDTSHNHCYIEGRVTIDKEVPITSVGVKIEGTNFSAPADSNGHYKLFVNDSLIGKKVKIIFATKDGPLDHVLCKIDRLPFKKDYDVSLTETVQTVPYTTGIVSYVDTLPHFHFTDSNRVYDWAEKMPEYKDLYEYLANKIEYPKSMIQANIEGTVYVSFIVEKDGSVSTVSVIRGVPGGSDLDAEAVRVIRGMPKWNPGKYGKTSVRVECKLPIRFQLSDKDSVKKG